MQYDDWQVRERAWYDDRDEQKPEKLTDCGDNLKMLEGTQVDLGGGIQIDTSMISFIFCGAFSMKSEEMAEKSGAAISDL